MCTSYGNNLAIRVSDKLNMSRCLLSDRGSFENFCFRNQPTFARASYLRIFNIFPY